MKIRIGSDKVLERLIEQADSLGSLEIIGRQLTFNDKPNLIAAKSKENSGKEC